LRAIFRDEARFAVHDALPGGQGFGDEGAANHTRLVGSRGAAHLFVHGREALGSATAPRRYPARQTLEASRAVARLGALDPSRVVHAQQHPEVIDAGVFHHDVIGVGHANVMLVHERAFLDRDGTLAALRTRLPDLVVAEVRESELSVGEAVSTYLFNSQIVTLPSGARAMIAPEEAHANDRARAVIERLVADGTLSAVHYFDLRESMQNGGGPACLRLRVALDAPERASLRTGLLDAAMIDRLEAWAKQHYRDRLRAEDLGDPALLDESRAALDALTQLLGLGSIYPFQIGDGAL
jgi:succinylarginine dihydrolase